jgi:hypothetical protein
MVWGGHDVQLGRENLVEAGHAVLVAGASAPVGSAHHCTHRKTPSEQQQQQQQQQQLLVKDGHDVRLASSRSVLS